MIKKKKKIRWGLANVGLLIVLTFVSLVSSLFIYKLDQKDSKLVVIHGPHIGEKLEFVAKSHSQDGYLAAVAQSKFFAENFTKKSHILQVTTSTEKFNVDQRIKTISNVNVRLTARSNGKLLGRQKMGSLGTVVSGPVSSDGIKWWKIDYDYGADGYSAPDFLVPNLPPVVATAPTTQNSPSPVPVFVPVINTTSPSPVSSLTPTPSASLIPVLVPVPVPAPTPTNVSRVDNRFGIAAGGSLMWMNQTDLDKYFSDLKGLGVTWVRWDMDWSAIQPRDVNSFVWTNIDRVVNTARNNGIKSLAIITYAPTWAETSNCPRDSICPPADPVQFAKFAGIVASRYKGIIDAYEIWNEPNLIMFWATGANFSDYSELLKLSYTEIKKVDPNVTVLSGGLAASADEGGSISPITFVKGLYSSNANYYFDAVALHPYSYPVLPSYVASWNSWQQMYTIRNYMVSNGESSKKIWVTEYGAPTGGPGTSRDSSQLSFSYGSDYMNESAQQGMILQVTDLFSRNFDWMGGFFWYSLKDLSTNRDTPENFFGLIRFDGSRKPAFDTMKNFLSTF